jgi:hypothetical protein
VNSERAWQLERNLAKVAELSAQEKFAARLAIHQRTPERAIRGALMGIKDRQCKGEREENTGEPRGQLHQYVGRLRPRKCYP